MNELSELLPIKHKSKLLQVRIDEQILADITAYKDANMLTWKEVIESAISMLLKVATSEIIKDIENKNE